jgi:hypothetical protein
MVGRYACPHVTQMGVTGTGTHSRSVRGQIEKAFSSWRRDRPVSSDRNPHDGFPAAGAGQRA